MLAVTCSCSASCVACLFSILSFFFNDTATTEIYTLSLHDALPICERDQHPEVDFDEQALQRLAVQVDLQDPHAGIGRSEEHTSELQSQFHLVCRLLLEKKNK